MHKAVADFGMGDLGPDLDQHCDKFGCLLVCLVLHCPMREIRVALPGLRHRGRKSSVTHSHRCMEYFRMSKQSYGCQCLRFLTCSQMLMHGIAQGDCTDTGRESVPEADSGRKITCRTGDSNLHQYCAWRFSRTLCKLSYPRPK